METEKETCMRPKWMTKLLGCSSSRGGTISTDQLPVVLAELNPGLNVNKSEMNTLIRKYDPDGLGVLDFDTVTKILFQLVLKQPSQDEDALETSAPLLNIYDYHHGSANSDCGCNVPGACTTAIKITDFIIFPTF